MTAEAAFVPRPTFADTVRNYVSLTKPRIIH